MFLLTAKTLSRRPGLFTAHCLHCFFFDIEREQLICEYASVLFKYVWIVEHVYINIYIHICKYVSIYVHTSENILIYVLICKYIFI